MYYGRQPRVARHRTRPLTAADQSLVHVAESQMLLATQEAKRAFFERRGGGPLNLEERFQRKQQACLASQQQRREGLLHYMQRHGRGPPIPLRLFIPTGPLDPAGPPLGGEGAHGFQRPPQQQAPWEQEPPPAYEQHQPQQPRAQPQAQFHDPTQPSSSSEEDNEVIFMVYRCCTRGQYGRSDDGNGNAAGICAMCNHNGDICSN